MSTVNHQKSGSPYQLLIVRFLSYQQYHCSHCTRSKRTIDKGCRCTSPVMQTNGNLLVFNSGCQYSSSLSTLGERSSKVHDHTTFYINFKFIYTYTLWSTKRQWKCFHLKKTYNICSEAEVWTCLNDLLMLGNVLLFVFSILVRSPVKAMKMSQQMMGPTSDSTSNQRRHPGSWWETVWTWTISEV